MNEDTAGNDGAHRCSLCDATLSSVEELQAHLVAEHDMDGDAHQVRQLRELVDRFDEGMDKALTLKREKERLEERVRDLEAERTELKETVEGLRDTRNTLKKKLKEKEDRVAELVAQIKAKKRSEIASGADVDALEDEMERLKEENRELRESLDHTEELFMRLRTQAEEFEEG